MAYQDKSKIQYWDGSNWTDVLIDPADPSTANALIDLSVDYKLGNPAKLKARFINRSNRPLDTTASNAVGNLNGIITEFTEVRALTGFGLVYFRGLVELSREVYDREYGTILQIEARDSLQELVDFTSDGLTGEEATYTAAASEGRSTAITDLLSTPRALNITTTNTASSATARFENSKVTWTSAETTAGEELEFNWAEGEQSFLKFLGDLANADSHGSNDDNFGFSYYVDANTISAASSTKQTPVLNYFARGSRPGLGGGTGAVGATSISTANPATYGLTVEYPNKSFIGAGEQLALMGEGFDFDITADEAYTSVILQYLLRDGTDTRVIRFERLECTLGAGSSFGDVSNGVDLYAPNSSVVACKLQYIGDTYVILSHIVESEMSGISILSKDANQSSAPWGGNYLSFTQATGRPLIKFNRDKPYRLKQPYSNFFTAKLGAVDFLSKNSTTALTRSSITISKFPYHSITASAANVSRATNVITFSTNAFGSGLNDVRAFGVKEGMVIAEMDSSKPNTVTRYSYISKVNTGGTSVTYGSSATDTSDSTALDASKNIRIYVPNLPGHLIKVKNALANYDGNSEILSMSFTESVGVQACSIEASGVNTAIGIRKSPLQISAEGGVDRGLPDKIPNYLKAFNFTGTFSILDYNTVEWTSGTLSIDGKEYSISAGDTGAMAVIGSSTPNYTIYFRPSVSTTTFSTLASASYELYSEDVILGTAHAVVDTTGSAIFLPANDVIRTSNTNPSLDIAQIANNAITNALLKQSAQPYNTDLDISGVDYNIISWSGATVTFADSSTVTINTTGSPKTLGAGTHYVYITALSGTVALNFSQTYSDAIGDTRVFLGTISVASSDDGSSSPSITVYGAKVPFVSAVSIAADAIYGDAIQAGVINTTKLNTSSAFVNLALSNTGNTVYLNSVTPSLALGSVASSMTYNSTGIWMGLNGGAYRLSIKSVAGDSLTFDGNNLNITGSISASTITGSTLTGGTVQTATSGNRLVLTGSTLSIINPNAGAAYQGITFTDGSSNIGYILNDRISNNIEIQTTGSSGYGISLNSDDGITMDAANEDITLSANGTNKYVRIGPYVGNVGGTHFGTGTGSSFNLFSSSYLNLLAYNGVWFYSNVGAVYNTLSLGTGSYPWGTVYTQGLQYTSTQSTTAYPGIYIGSSLSTYLISTSSTGPNSGTLYIGNQSITTSSDIRIKDNIVNTQLVGLDSISQLKVKDFTWNDPTDLNNSKNSRGVYTGLIAQEVIDIAPWAVNSQGAKDCPTCRAGEECNRHEGMWLLEYEYLVPILIKAVQELKLRVEELENGH